MTELVQTTVYLPSPHRGTFEQEKPSTNIRQFKDKGCLCVRKRSCRLQTPQTCMKFNLINYKLMFIL